MFVKNGRRGGCLRPPSRRFGRFVLFLDQACFNVVLFCAGVKGDGHSRKGELKVEVFEVIQPFPEECGVFMKHLRDFVDNFLGHILVGEEGANRSYNGDILVIAGVNRQE